MLSPKNLQGKALLGAKGPPKVKSSGPLLKLASDSAKAAKSTLSAPKSDLSLSGKSFIVSKEDMPLKPSIKGSLLGKTLPKEGTATLKLDPNISNRNPLKPKLSGTAPLKKNLETKPIGEVQKVSISGPKILPGYSDSSTLLEGTFPFDIGPAHKLIFQDKVQTNMPSNDAWQTLNILKREQEMFQLHVSVLNPKLSESAEHSLAALSQSFKEQLAVRHFTLTTAEKNNLLFGKATRARPQTVSEKFGTMSDSLLLLQRLEDTRIEGEIHEIQRISQRLRTSAIDSFMKSQYADALLKALHCYELCRAFLSKLLGHPLEGVMVVELIIISKCCGLAGDLAKGEIYLRELRYLVENTIIVVANDINDVNNAKSSSGNPSNSVTGVSTQLLSGMSGNNASVQGPTISCEPSVLCSLVLTLADLCSLYRDHNSAKFYFEKYLLLMYQIYGPEDLVMSDAYLTVASYYFRVKDFNTCKKLILACLEIRIHILGDHDKIPPHPRVADCYSNLGLICRLTGEIKLAMQYIMVALDMQMRINRRRDCLAVQDCMLALGCIFHQAGNFRYALEIYNEVYRFRREYLGFMHTDTRFVYHLIRQLDADTQVHISENSQSYASLNMKQDIFEQDDGEFQNPISLAENRLRNIVKEAIGRAQKLSSIMYEESALLASPLAPSIDQFRYKQLETFLYDTKYKKNLKIQSLFDKKQASQIMSVSRIRALYGETFQSMTVNSTVILPHLQIKITGPDYLAVSTMLALPPFAKGRRRRLPIVNIPKLQKGFAVMGEQGVTMTLNEDVIPILKEWQIPEPCVTLEGKVTIEEQKNANIKVPYLLPLVDSKGTNDIKAYYKEIIWVPNPVYPLYVTRILKEFNDILDTNHLTNSTTLNDSTNSVTSRLAKYSMPLPSNTELESITGVRPGIEDTDSGRLPCVECINSQGKVILKLPYSLNLESFACASTRLTLMAANQWNLPLQHPNQTSPVVPGSGLEELLGSMAQYKPFDAASSAPNFDGIPTGMPLANLLEGIGTIQEPIVKTEPKEAPKVKPDAKSPPAKGPEAKGKGPLVKGAPHGKGAPPQGKGPVGLKGPPKGKGTKAFGKAKKFAGPASKIKKLHWEKVENVQSTIWDVKEPVKLDFGNLEEIFGLDTNKAKKAAPETKKPKVLQILPDSKRAYNISIALSRFNNYTYQQLRDAILDLDEHILDVEATEALISMSPTPEEMTIVKEFIDAGGDLTQLDKPEQFIAAMIGIPLFTQRLNAQLYKLTFNNTWSTLEGPLEDILGVCNEIRGSLKLKKVFSIILSIGNIMNSNTDKGDAKGFRISSLSKLSEVRSSTKPVKTLIQYIGDIIWRDKPELLNLAESLNLLEKVTKCDLGIIEGEIQSLSNGLTKLQNTMKLAQKTNEQTGPLGDKDPIAKILSEFIADAEPKIDDLNAILKTTKEQLEKIALYLGEPQVVIPKIVWADFFSTLWTFISTLDNIRRTKEEEQKRQKQKENARQREKSASLIKIKTTEKKINEISKHTTVAARPVLQKQRMVVTMAPKANAVKTSKLDEMASWFASSPTETQTPAFLQDISQKPADISTDYTQLDVDVDLW
ncbi:formin-like family protein [Cryptosporidium serpentis]